MKKIFGIIVIFVVYSQYTDIAIASFTSTSSSSENTYIIEYIFNLSDITITPWVLLTAIAGLAAFNLGLYTLVGKERKSPYIINSIYPVFLLCMCIAAMTLLTTLLPNKSANITLKISVILLIYAFILSAFRVYQVMVRTIFFVDSVSPKHWPIIRHIRRLKYSFKKAPTYSHNSIAISEDLKGEIINLLSEDNPALFESREEISPLSLALAVDHQGQGNRLLADIAKRFLSRGYSVQYLTASRHPIEFVGYLKENIESDSSESRLEWKEAANRIVVIDAYSPHFAFIDSIYPTKSGELRYLGVALVTSKRTYAGMHTASSRAFNIIRKKQKDETRRPTLIIYEDTYALSDLESPEQYRIFVRHVIPSERMWDGMFTVFVESAQSEANWRTLQSYASMRLDLRSYGLSPLQQSSKFTGCDPHCDGNITQESEKW